MRIQTPYGVQLKNAYIIAQHSHQSSSSATADGEDKGDRLTLVSSSSLPQAKQHQEVFQQAAKDYRWDNFCSAPPLLVPLLSLRS